MCVRNVCDVHLYHWGPVSGANQNNCKVFSEKTQTLKAPMHTKRCMRARRCSTRNSLIKCQECAPASTRPHHWSQSTKGGNTKWVGIKKFSENFKYTNINPWRSEASEDIHEDKQPKGQSTASALPSAQFTKALPRPVGRKSCMS